MGTKTTRIGNGSIVLAVASVLMALLAGCGGGGGGAGGATPGTGGTTANGSAATGGSGTAGGVTPIAPGVRPLRAMPVDKAPELAAAAWRAGSLVSDLSAVAALAAVTDDDGRQAEVGRAMFRQVMRLRERQWTIDTGAPVTALLAPVAVPCAGGGDYIGTLDDKDNDGRLSTGDTLRLQFRQCVEEGLVTDGLLTGDALAFRGTSAVDAPWSMSGRFGFDDFTVWNGADAGRASGLLTIDASGIGTRESTATMNASDLTVRLNGTAQSLADYELRQTERAGAWTQSFKGKFMHGTLGGWFEFATDVPLSGPMGQVQPDAGAYAVRGAGASSARIVFLPAGQGVRVDVDRDGDGTTETGTTRTWASFVQLQ